MYYKTSVYVSYAIRKSETSYSLHLVVDGILFWFAVLELGMMLGCCWFGHVGSGNEVLIKLKLKEKGIQVLGITEGIRDICQSAMHVTS